MSSQPRSRPYLFIVIVLTAVAGPPPAAGQEPGRGAAAPDSLLSLGHYLHWEQVQDPRISPNGSRIVYTRQRVDRMEDEWESELWAMRSEGTRKRHLVDGSSPVWSPSGDRIAYVAEDEDGRPQIFVRWMDGSGNQTQITHLRERPHHVQWGPDGERLAFLKSVPVAESWRAAIPDAPGGAEWTDPPRVIDRIHYRLDPRGFTEDAYTHLFTVDAAGGTARQVTSGEWNVGARLDGIPYFLGFPYDWGPEGQRIVFDGYRADTGAEADANFTTSHLYSVDLGTREIRRLTTRPGTWAGPVVSPDGERVAFTGYGPDHPIYYPTALWVKEIDGEAGQRKISGDLDRDAGQLFWAPDGEGVYFSVPDHGRSNVYYAPADGSGPEQVTEGRHMLSLTSVADDGTAAGVRSAPRDPGDVVRLSLSSPGDLQTLTSVNDDVLEDVTLGRIEEIRYRSTGGQQIQGWIVKPSGFDASREYPLVLAVHGGPHGMYGVGFDYGFQNFAANGYVVLYTNPRGSAGYGTEFAAAIHRRGYPSVDHDDLMAGVDSLVARGYVDADRLFVTGCSGGGKLSSWAITRTDRFAAAAVRCPVTNWISMAGTSDVPLWTHNWFEEPFWEDPSEWLEHSSLMHVGEVETPTLLMTGELDARTPISQSEEFYQALKKRGVSTVLLRFRKEHHGTGSRPSNFLRTQSYMIEWFENEGRIEGVTVPEE